jgi:hypothetical protein
MTPTVRRERKISVSHEWHRIVRSSRYKEFLQSSVLAPSSTDIARAESRIWNVRYGYAPERSECKGALKGALVEYIENLESQMSRGKSGQDGEVEMRCKGESGDGVLVSGVGYSADFSNFRMLRKSGLAQ